MTYQEISRDPEILALIEKGNAILGALGFTDHSRAHTGLVARRAGDLLEAFGYDPHQVELARIAGFVHDIGNAINRSHHAEYGAILLNQILAQKGMPLEDRLTVVSAVANHDESTGNAFDPVSAALIIGDKTDVRRNRVRAKDHRSFDIHDRVNWAVTNARLEINAPARLITLDLDLDESLCTMYDYFDIFLGRMQMCRHGAEVLGARFKLVANGSKVL